MAGQDTIQGLSGTAGDAFEDAPTTSVEELLGIFAELSERVARLERATVLLLAERNGAELAAAADLQHTPEAARSEPPPRASALASEAAREAPVAGGVDVTQVAFDLPAHQWGGEGGRSPDALTPIRDSQYPEIKYVDEEDKPKPKRTGPAERVFVRAALEAYPHIVEAVCIFWGGRECDTYLSKLVIDTRGGRRGFPREVMDELLFLTEVATIQSGLKPVFTPFDSDKHLQR